MFTRPLRSSRTSRIAAASAVVLVGLSASFAPAAWAEDLELDSGHIDAFNVTAEGGNLKLNLKEDVTGSHVLHDPDSVTLRVKEEAWTDKTAQVPEVGTSGYYLPQTQDPNLIWPGWDTNGVRSGGFGEVDINFVKVSGPGQVYAFQTGSFGGNTPILADKGFEVRSGETIVQQEPAHVHTNWVFTAPGTYTMCVQAAADSATSNVARYVWSVGNGGPNTVASCDGEGEAIAVSARSGNDDKESRPSSSSSSRSTSSATTSSKPTSSKPAPAASPAKRQSLPETGPSYMTASFLVLGVGLAVFGAGTVRLVKAATRNK